MKTLSEKESMGNTHGFREKWYKESDVAEAVQRFKEIKVELRDLGLTYEQGVAVWKRTNKLVDGIFGEFKDVKSTKEETTEKIKKLQNQMMTISMSGFAYTDKWNELAKEKNKLQAQLNQDSTKSEPQYPLTEGEKKFYTPEIVKIINSTKKKLSHEDWCVCDHQREDHECKPDEDYSSGSCFGFGNCNCDGFKIQDTPKKLDLEDWEDDKFGSNISDDYKKGFNDSLFFIRSQIKDVQDTKNVIGCGKITRSGELCGTHVDMEDMGNYLDLCDECFKLKKNVQDTKGETDNTYDYWIDEIMKKGETAIRVELEDYCKVADTFSKVLDRVTKGKMSKPNYTWEAIEEVLDEVEEEEEEEEEQNRKQNEGICKCGHLSQDHSFEPIERNTNLYCDNDECDCQDYEFDRFSEDRQHAPGGENGR